MSGFRTHMLIGAVGGAALAKALTVYALLPLPTGDAQLGEPYMPLGLTGIGIIIGSAVLATWPDIDEPGSWPARRLKAAVTMVSAPLVGAMGYGIASLGQFSMRPEIAAVVDILVGAAVIGPVLGYLLLRLIRIGAGGHRRLTHSAVLGGVFAVLAVTLWRMGQPVWAIVPAALVWGQLLHVLGDVVTPTGVPLLYPISGKDVGLPRPFSTYSETLITVVAAGIGYIVLLS